jgi:SMI1 / KNR4 family (SUKH-1)
MKPEFANACLQLLHWCESSQGAPIDIGDGRPLKFVQLRAYSSEELDAFEARHGLSLPPSYRHFMAAVGACKLFINRYGLGTQFHPLEGLDRFSAEVFDNAGTDPFPRLLLVASVTLIGDLAGFDLTSDVERFAVFSHEDDPDSWLTDTSHWYSFEECLPHLVSTKGNELDL